MNYTDAAIRRAFSGRYDTASEDIANPTDEADDGAPAASPRCT
jgi:hypothetical protein